MNFSHKTRRRYHPFGNKGSEEEPNLKKSGLLMLIGKAEFGVINRKNGEFPWRRLRGFKGLIWLMGYLDSGMVHFCLEIAYRDSEKI